MSYVISAYLVFYISIFIYATRLIIRCNHLEQENEDNSITINLLESVRQLRGECGDRQVNNATLALASGTGGVLSSNSTCILVLE